MKNVSEKVASSSQYPRGHKGGAWLAQVNPAPYPTLFNALRLSNPLYPLTITSTRTIEARLSPIQLKIGSQSAIKSAQMKQSLSQKSTKISGNFTPTKGPFIHFITSVQSKDSAKIEQKRSAIRRVLNRKVHSNADKCPFNKHSKFNSKASNANNNSAIHLK